MNPYLKGCFMSDLIKVFLIAMLPIIELRGAIPIAAALRIPHHTAYFICIIGNMLPVPVILLFSGKVLHWGKNKPYIGKIFTFFIEKGYKSGKKLEDKAGFALYLALALFVGIPLPGTGAWTGSLAASLLGMNVKKSIIAVLSGVLLSGIIISVASFGLTWFFR